MYEYECQLRPHSTFVGVHNGFLDHRWGPTNRLLPHQHPETLIEPPSVLCSSIRKRMPAQAAAPASPWYPRILLYNSPRTRLLEMAGSRGTSLKTFETSACMMLENR